MSERKRTVANAEILAIDGNDVKLRHGDEELSLEFSRYYRGEDREALAAGRRIHGTVYRDRFLSDVALADAGEAADGPPENGDGGTADRILRTSAGKIAAMILQTRGEPVHLQKLFSYARWIERALREGFERADAALQAQSEEYRLARERERQAEGTRSG